MLNDKQIEKTYSLIQKYHKKYLAKRNVKNISLKSGGKYTKDALVLIYLAQGYPKTKQVSKTELTKFIQYYFPDVNDVQQGRHLAAQKGWYILSGTRNDFISEIKIKPGHYLLLTLEDCYPDYKGFRRVAAKNLTEYFKELKKTYDNRCATCGSKEGQLNLKWKGTKTVLQMGHMDPSKPLEPGNIIPQCEKCNRASRNWWIYDDKGNVIAIANPNVVDRCSKKIKQQIFDRLKQQLKK